MERNNSSTRASPEQLIRIINEDNELLPGSKRTLINFVRSGKIETIDQLNNYITTSKRVDGTANNSTVVSPEQLIRIINGDNELLPKSKRSLINFVRVGNIETIEQLNNHIAKSKRLDGTANNSTVTTPEQLIKIINEDNELLPGSKRTLIHFVITGKIETIGQLNNYIATSKRLDGTANNSTVVSPEQLIKIINEDNELLPGSRRSLINFVRTGDIETIERLNDYIATSKRLDGTANNSTVTTPEQLIKIINEDNELLPGSKRSLINFVRTGDIETIERLNDYIATSKRLDGTANNSTVTTPEQLIKIINEDNELLPESKRSLINFVRTGDIETIERLNDYIATSKRLDGTTSNSTLASPEQLIKIINEDNELLPESKRSLINFVRTGNIETLEKLDEYIATSKRFDGHL